MKVNGQECSFERAYDLLAANASLADKLEASPQERARFVAYAEIRAHHDYLRDLDDARRGY